MVKIRGITIEIGGDTTGLEKALKSVNSSIPHTQSALKDVNKQLKLDLSNTELLSQWLSIRTCGFWKRASGKGMGNIPTLIYFRWKCLRISLTLWQNMQTRPSRTMWRNGWTGSKRFPFTRCAGAYQTVGAERADGCLPECLKTESTQNINQRLCVWRECGDNRRTATPRRN